MGLGWGWGSGSGLLGPGPGPGPGLGLGVAKSPRDLLERRAARAALLADPELRLRDEQAVRLLAQLARLQP